jgi:crotonobetainyl-CoA:carnitine CoA-transferase CaiB-like acyl-CoA transferase
VPTTLTRTPAAVRTAAPEKGEHTEEVLREIGLNASDIQRLRTDGVIQ